MNAFAVLFALTSAGAILLLKRQWAALPLLAGVCYMTLAQGIVIGPFRFPVLRLLLAVGFLRVLVRGERPVGKPTVMDLLMILWGAWALISSAFHNEPKETLTFHLGMVYNCLGVYVLFRCLCRSMDDLADFVGLTAIVLLPIALEMAGEQLTHRNAFSFLGGVPEVVTIRADRLRAQGPFGHPILAGTVGAVCAPLMFALWQRAPILAKAGLGACLLMVVASASSGPLMSMLFGAFAVLLWRWRRYTRGLRIAAVVGYVILDLVMRAPAYFIIARFDLTGSSTGWHRAELMRSAFEHFNEWWVAGTDYTRHWMASGVHWSPDHADITNYYLKMGVLGGLPLMVLLIGIVWCGFRSVGRALQPGKIRSREQQFLVWCFGAGLFAHATTAISVSYFDQSYVFLYANLAAMNAFSFATASTQRLPRAGGSVDKSPQAGPTAQRKSADRRAGSAPLPSTGAAQY